VRHLDPETWAKVEQAARLLENLLSFEPADCAGCLARSLVESANSGVCPFCLEVPGFDAEGTPQLCETPSCRLIRKRLGGMV
jgi:hypothetical protein